MPETMPETTPGTTPETILPVGRRAHRSRGSSPRGLVSGPGHRACLGDGAGREPVRRLGGDAAAEVGPVGGPHGAGPTGDDRPGRPGAQGEGGGLLAVDDQAGRRCVGAEVGQVVLGQLGGDVAAEGVGVLGATWRTTPWSGRWRETASRSSSGSWPRCWWASTMDEPVAAGLGQHLVEAAGQVQEVLALVDVPGRRRPGPPGRAGPGGWRSATPWPPRSCRAGGRCPRRGCPWAPGPGRRRRRGPGPCRSWSRAGRRPGGRSRGAGTPAACS